MRNTVVKYRNVTEKIRNALQIFGNDIENMRNVFQLFCNAFEIMRNHIQKLINYSYVRKDQFYSSQCGVQVLKKGFTFNYAYMFLKFEEPLF